MRILRIAAVTLAQELDLDAGAAHRRGDAAQFARERICRLGPAARLGGLRIDELGELGEKLGRLSLPIPAGSPSAGERSKQSPTLR